MQPLLCGLDRKEQERAAVKIDFKKYVYYGKVSMGMGYILDKAKSC